MFCFSHSLSVNIYVCRRCSSEVSSNLRMGLKALPWSPSQNGIVPIPQSFSKCSPPARTSRMFQVVSVKKDTNKANKEETNEEVEKKKKKQSLFSSVAEALDFSQVRSVQDAELLEEAREATQSGEQMTREQYGALRRKIGGTYKDFFKSYVEVDGQYVEEGWVDKTCKVCKKDTNGEARQVDNLGRYVHVACLGKSKSPNFFTRLFSR